MRFAETKANHAYVVAGVEGLTMIFWFAGFLALAVWLGNRVCFGHVCSAAKAATAFGAFAWYVTRGNAAAEFFEMRFAADFLVLFQGRLCDYFRSCRYVSYSWARWREQRQSGSEAQYVGRRLEV